MFDREHDDALERWLDTPADQELIDAAEGLDDDDGRPAFDVLRDLLDDGAE